jgi:hypothetical protein
MNIERMFKIKTFVVSRFEHLNSILVIALSPTEAIAPLPLTPIPNRPSSTHNPDSGQNEVNPVPTSSQKFALNHFSRKGLLGQVRAKAITYNQLKLNAP